MVGGTPGTPSRLQTALPLNSNRTAAQPPDLQSTNHCQARKHGVDISPNTSIHMSRTSTHAPATACSPCASETPNLQPPTRTSTTPAPSLAGLAPRPSPHAHMEPAPQRLNPAYPYPLDPPSLRSAAGVRLKNCRHQSVHSGTPTASAYDDSQHDTVYAPIRRQTPGATAAYGCERLIKTGRMPSKQHTKKKRRLTPGTCVGITACPVSNPAASKNKNSEPRARRWR